MFTLQTKLNLAKTLITNNSPFYVQFFITSRCNLKCKMCNICQATRSFKEIPLEKIIKIADNLKIIGVGIVLLSGGEPFIRKDLPEIVKIFTDRNINVRLQTAGLRTEDSILKQCVINGATDISVSLDTLNEDLGDYINGVKGSWQRAVDVICQISRIFPNKSSVCGLGCVLSRYNFLEIPKILDFATQIGWVLSLVPVHFTLETKDLSFRSRSNDFEITNKYIPLFKETINVLKKMKNEGHNLFDSDKYLDSIVNYVDKQEPRWRINNICDSPNLYFIILPNGDFAPCCDRFSPVNVSTMDKDFPRILKSKEFKNKIENITKNCIGCHYGSYPEVTLTFRTWAGFKERVKLYLKQEKKSIRIFDENDNISEIIKDLNVKYGYLDKKTEELFDLNNMTNKADNIV